MVMAGLVPAIPIRMALRRQTSFAQKVFEIPFDDPTLIHVSQSICDEFFQDAIFLALLEQVSDRRLPHLFRQQIERGGSSFTEAFHETHLTTCAG
jgi:hypothetical protein